MKLAFKHKYCKNDLMNWKKDYHPAPVNIEDIVDAEVLLEFKPEETEANGQQVANFTEEITALIKSISLSGQTLILPEDLCSHGNFDTSEIKCFIRERVAQHLEANYLRSPEVQAGVFEATVVRLHSQYNSLRLDIIDPRYDSGRTVFIDNLARVTEALGHEPKAGEILKVTNVRFTQSVKTPDGNGGTRSWSNQRVADLHQA